MCLGKQFVLGAADVKPLATGFGSCIAPDKITVEGRTVGYMYREVPDNELDSGWRFFAGDESEDYTADAQNFGVFDVNTIANYDTAIIALLGAPIATAYARNEGGKLVAVNQ